MRTRGQGVHHIMFRTPNYEDCARRLTDEGISVLGESELQETRFHLFDTTADLGLICEIAEGGALVPDSIL